MGGVGNGGKKFGSPCWSGLSTRIHESKGGVGKKACTDLVLG